MTRLCNQQHADCKGGQLTSWLRFFQIPHYVEDRCCTTVAGIAVRRCRCCGVTRRNSGWRLRKGCNSDTCKRHWRSEVRVIRERKTRNMGSYTSSCCRRERELWASARQWSWSGIACTAKMLALGLCVRRTAVAGKKG